MSARQQVAAVQIGRSSCLVPRLCCMASEPVSLKPVLAQTQIAEAGLLIGALPARIAGRRGGDELEQWGQVRVAAAFDSPDTLQNATAFLREYAADTDAHAACAVVPRGCIAFPQVRRFCMAERLSLPICRCLSMHRHARGNPQDGAAKAKPSTCLMLLRLRGAEQLQCSDAPVMGHMATCRVHAS